MKLNDEHDGEYPQSFAPLKPRKRSARVINANEVLKKNDDSKSKIPDEYVNIGLPETDLSIADFSRKIGRAHV